MGPPQRQDRSVLTTHSFPLAGIGSAAGAISKTEHHDHVHVVRRAVSRPLLGQPAAATGYAEHKSNGSLLCRRVVVSTALFLPSAPDGCKKWCLPCTWHEASREQEKRGPPLHARSRADGALPQWPRSYTVACFLSQRLSVNKGTFLTRCCWQLQVLP